MLLPRHIEIQIMADSHGNILYLFEENVVFSVAIKSSRRSSFFVLTPELRKEMGEAAVMVAKSCDIWELELWNFYWMKTISTSLK
jgi:propionyl-CoA carboxylase alpha chain